MVERYGIIYKITNIINGKSYIGQTKNTFNERYKNNGEWWNYTTNLHLWNSANKYGKDNFFVIKEMDIAFSKRELDLKERFYISALECNNPKKGYNKNGGGGLSTEQIVVLDKGYNFVEVASGYDEIIAKGYTRHLSAICNVCRGRRGSSLGYRFYTEEDYLIMKKKGVENEDFRSFLFNKYYKKSIIKKVL